MARKRLPAHGSIAADRPAALGFASALRAYGGDLKSQASRLVRDPNAEAIHIYRVNLRALRSIFNAAGRIIPPDRRRALAVTFRWLSQRTAVRDLDVLLEAMPNYLAQLPEDSAAPLDATLRSIIAPARRAAARDLVAALRSPRYAAFERDWTACLDVIGLEPQSPPTLAERVSKAVTRRYRRIDEYSLQALGANEVRHELRKDCKRLRYLLEAFQKLFSPREFTTTIAALKAVQSAVGASWDASNHYSRLCAVMQHAPVPAESRAALNAILTRECATRSIVAMTAIADFKRHPPIPQPTAIPPHPTPSLSARR